MYSSVSVNANAQGALKKMYTWNRNYMKDNDVNKNDAGIIFKK